MNRLFVTFAKNFFPIFRRSCILLFKSQNRALVDVTELNGGQKNGKSVLKLKIDLSNILFLKIDNNYFPIFHDNVTLEIIIPLDSEKEKIDIKGIGIFKTSRTTTIEVSDVKKVYLNSFYFHRSGEFSYNIKNISYLKVYNTNAPKVISSNIGLNPIKFEMKTLKLPISPGELPLKLPNIESINTNQEDLFLALNKTI